ncbi:MAG: hypothetical protein ACLQDL_08485 [Spirochaetia bacterium]
MRYWLVVFSAVLIGLFGALAPAAALDYTGRVDTRFLFQAGDNAVDNDLYNYHSLEMTFSKGLTFSWYGGVIASLTPRVDSLSADGTEATDNALRTLQDAGNPGQYINYTIYSAYLKYDTGVYGAMLGRCTPADYELAQFDGLMVWAAPLAWLRLEALGGMPWHFAYTANPGLISTYWQAGEVAAGGGADLKFYDETLKFSLKYLFLRELTNSNGLISDSQETYMAADSLTKAGVNYGPQPWLNVGAGMSVLGISPFSFHTGASGDIDSIHLSYSADLESQFVDVSSISDRLTQFSALLTASDPYVDVSGEVTENFAGLVPLPAILTDAELELSYEHRQPVSSADLAMFNPEYDQFRLSTLFGAKGGWTLQVFFSFLVTSNIQNTLTVVGGEIGRKWGVLDVRLGSSFNASLYETDYTQTIIQDSFYDQEYYLKVKWQVNKSFDLSLKGSYENVLLTSITNANVVPLNTDVDYTVMSGLDDSARNYFRVDLRAGYRY